MPREKQPSLHFAEAVLIKKVYDMNNFHLSGVCGNSHPFGFLVVSSLYYKFMMIILG
jgi:hypothetical protein